MPGSITHVVFPIIGENICIRYLMDKLNKTALLVSGICLLILSTILAIPIVYGIVHSVLLPCLLFSLCSGIFLVSVGIVLRLRIKPPIPEGFLTVLRAAYPSVICELVLKQRLELYELRDILSWLDSGDFIFDTSREKAEKFGFERLQTACGGVELLDLEDLLLTHCPFYLINEFIQLGPREFPELEDLDPPTYWLSRLGLSDSLDTVFHPYVWMFAQSTSQNEYEQLLLHARNATWDRVEHIREDPLWGKIATPWLLYLCKHGVTWEQLSLFKKIYMKSVRFLYDSERSDEGRDLARIISSISNYICEDDEGFDSSITLITWEEWMRDCQENSRRPGWCFYEGTIDFLNKHSKNVLNKIEREEDFPYYTIDKITGMRRVD
ncbi:DUF1389 domain-containing protein [Chlamydia sp. 04-14]|uniref:DUF1389 domain-containing protein n=1 Tax=Chlamydia TaxID=810 RepID=UPI002FCB8801